MIGGGARPCLDWTESVAGGRKNKVRTSDGTCSRVEASAVAKNQICRSLYPDASFIEHGRVPLNPITSDAGVDTSACHSLLSVVRAVIIPDTATGRNGRTEQRRFGISPVRRLPNSPFRIPQFGF
jgi:hypothetical protein